MTRRHRKTDFEKTMDKVFSEFSNHWKNRKHPIRTGMCKECSFEFFDGVEKHAFTCSIAEKKELIREIVENNTADEDVTEETAIVSMNVDQVKHVDDPELRKKFSVEVRELYCKDCKKQLIMAEDTYEIYLKHKNPVICVDCFMPGLLKS